MAVLPESGPLRKSAQNFELEVLFEWVEIAIFVEKRKASLNTESGNPTIDNLAYREPLGSKFAIICRTLDRVTSADHWIDPEV